MYHLFERIRSLEIFTMYPRLHMYKMFEQLYVR